MKMFLTHATPPQRSIVFEFFGLSKSNLQEYITNCFEKQPRCVFVVISSGQRKQRRLADRASLP